MYLPTEPLLISNVDRERGGVSTYEVWHSNGSYVRTAQGRMVGKFKYGLALFYSAEIDEKYYFGHATDELLVSRVMEYMECYFGKKYTNCSAFAHFLTTGKFVECEEEKGLLVIEQGMQIYDGHKVRVGDMLCIVFADQERLGSRTEDWRRLYMHSKKERHRDGRFTHALRLSQKSFAPNQIRNIVRDYRTNDYHFMVCVGKYNDKPVWISQWGRYRPEKDEEVSIIVTVGDHDCYTPEVPLLTFIKRRR